MMYLPIQAIVSSSAATLSSPFEDAIAALSPIVHHTFRDTDFTSQVSDVSGNGYHLLKQIATANRGAAIRSTHPGGLYVPPTLRSVWNADGVFYKTPNNAFASAIASTQAFTTVLSLKYHSRPVSFEQGIWGVTTPNTSITNSTRLVIWGVSPSDGLVDLTWRSSSGAGIPATTTVSSHVDDSRALLLIYRRGYQSPRTLTSSSAANGVNLTESTNINNYSPTLASGPLNPLALNQRCDASTNAIATMSYTIDNAAFFTTALSLSDIANLHTLWDAERI